MSSGVGLLGVVGVGSIGKYNVMRQRHRLANDIIMWCHRINHIYFKGYYSAIDYFTVC